MVYGFNDEKEKVKVLSENETIDYIKNHIEGTKFTYSGIDVKGHGATTIDIDWATSITSKLVSILGIGVYITMTGVPTPYFDTEGMIRIVTESLGGEKIRYYIIDTDSRSVTVRLEFILNVLKEPS